MRPELKDYVISYCAALTRRLQERNPQKRSAAANKLGLEAIALGLETLDLARIHEKALLGLHSPRASLATRKVMICRASSFFRDVMAPLEKTHRTAREAKIRLEKMIGKLSQRGLELVAANRRLKQEVIQRRSAEASLRKSEKHYNLLLGQSLLMQEQLRTLSRQLLIAQEEERKKISRELHDVIAQTLTGINVQLMTLKKEAALDVKGLNSNITRTQVLVEESVNIVHEFARELRPTLLDDLGLIPALHSFMKNFRQETGIRVSLTTFAAIEQVTEDKRTVFYRVIQEALTNVARHAKASQADVSIEKRDGSICIDVQDNGKGFRSEHVLKTGNRRLGLLGMRERLEMLGGTFSIVSKPSKGTTIAARIPLVDPPGTKIKTHRLSTWKELLI